VGLVDGTNVHRHKRIAFSSGLGDDFGLKWGRGFGFRADGGASSSMSLLAALFYSTARTEKRVADLKGKAQDDR